MKGQETHFLDFFARGRSDFGGLPRFFFGGSGWFSGKSELKIGSNVFWGRFLKLRFGGMSPRSWGLWTCTSSLSFAFANSRRHFSVPNSCIPVSSSLPSQYSSLFCSRRLRSISKIVFGPGGVLFARHAEDRKLFLGGRILLTLSRIFSSWMLARKAVLILSYVRSYLTVQSDAIADFTSFRKRLSYTSVMSWTQVCVSSLNENTGSIRPFSSFVSAFSSWNYNKK